MNGRLVDWIRAAHHENYGGAKGSFPQLLLWQLAVIIAAAYFVGGPAMAAMFPWIFIGNASLQLHVNFLYPLSRKKRADLFFASSLVESAAAVASGFAAVSALIWLHGRYGSPLPDPPTWATLHFILMFAAWSPIAHWPKVYGPIAGTRNLTAKQALRMVGFLSLFVVLGATSAESLDELSSTFRMPTYAIAGLVAATVHGIYWLAIQRRFARADLVAPQ